MLRNILQYGNTLIPKEAIQKAIVKMPDGEAKEIGLSSWADYENSDAISIIGENGEHIYTHLNNVVLIGE